MSPPQLPSPDQCKANRAVRLARLQEKRQLRHLPTFKRSRPKSTVPPTQPTPAPPTPTQDQRRRRHMMRQRKRRASMSEAERDEQRRKDAQRKRQRRSRESTAESSARIVTDRSSTQSQRADRTPTQVHEARQANSEARRVAREAGQETITLLFKSQPGIYFHVGSMDVECPHCKALHWIYERVIRSSPTNPDFSDCCARGKVKQELLKDPPAYLKRLFTAQTSTEKAFRSRTRQYNTALAMGSVTANWPQRGPGSSRYNPTISVHGVIYHKISAFVDPEDNNLTADPLGPTFLSVYIHDTEYSQQSEQKRWERSELDAFIVFRLRSMLFQINGYAKSFKCIQEWANSKDGADKYRMVIHADKPPAESRRTTRMSSTPYDRPAASEVAAIIPGIEDGDVGRRDIVLRRRVPSSQPTTSTEVTERTDPFLQNIDINHRSADPLCYPLLFPYGEDGWYTELKNAIPAQRTAQGSEEELADEESNWTVLRFYAWKMFQRPSEFSILLRSCRLFQQYIVDQYCKIEADRLEYFNKNQKSLRASDYTELCEALADAGGTEDETELVRTGRLKVLPSTFVGGDRYMRQNMHDIIAISNKIGHPDLFITMTCNPNWKEIQGALLQGQKAEDRPDLCNRVFRMKMRALMEFVEHDKPFGVTVAYIRVIEFQKRGLPHAHIIVFLDRASKQALRNTENVDKIISAEIPSQENGPLRELVLKHMIHNKCGPYNPTSVCMKNGSCSKQFPKTYMDETDAPEDAYYPSYRRRHPQSGGHTSLRRVRRNNQWVDEEVDNAWVVPYNKDLLQMFECHLNVEICLSRVGGIKYLFKYVCKGPDRITVSFQRDGTAHIDEIKTYVNGRYVSATEGHWRISKFDVIDRKPNVYRLDIHTPDHHTVYYREDLAHAAVNRLCPGTKLTEWFEANKKFPNASHIKYLNFCSYFTWSNSEKVWNPRHICKKEQYKRTPAPSTVPIHEQYDFTGRGEKTVGRIYTLSPREGERYFLRTLLLHQPGCTSFEALRTVDEELQPSFREACVKMGLLGDDDEWKRALRECFQSTFEPLTRMFAVILQYCNPAEPDGLLLARSQKEMFVKDIRQRYRGNADALGKMRQDRTAFQYVLKEIQGYLAELGNNKLADFHLPMPEPGLPPLVDIEPPSEQIAQEMLLEQVHVSVPQLNEGQRKVFDEVVGSIIPGVTTQSLDGGASHQPSVQRGSHSNCFLLDAPGGSGKTFCTTVIHKYLKMKGMRVISVASSAVAAQLLLEGRTAHSVFKIPIPIAADSTCTISFQSDYANKLKDACLIVWDEISMAHRFNIEAVDRLFRDLMQCPSVPFGGKCILFIGDFRQILTVVPGGSRGQIVTSCFKSSQLYKSFKVLKLTQNMRLEALRRDTTAPQSTLDFPNFLLRVGNGTLPTNEYKEVQLPSYIARVQNHELLCDKIFEGIEQNYKDTDWLTSRAILTTKNANLGNLNTRVGNKIPGAWTTFLSADTVENAEQNELFYPVEFLNRIPGSAALPDHNLSLKVGSIVMLLRNMNPFLGHVNGARYVVDNVTTNVLLLTLATGPNKGTRFALPRVPCSPGDENFPIPGFLRRQFPVRPCFAMTINKAQGQSIRSRLGLDFTEECFSHGQLYVALSRTTHPSNITYTPSKDCISPTMTKNVVYPEVLSQH